MPEHAARIADLKARLAVLEAERAARQAADEHTRLSEELQPEPEPGAVLYRVSLHPDQAHERILATGHGVGGHAGLGAAVGN
jgi:hypothetical protein